MCSPSKCLPAIIGSHGLDKLTTRTQPVAKKIAIASGATDYNILQNNGKIAHQEVGHVSSFCEKP